MNNSFAHEYNIPLLSYTLAFKQFCDREKQIKKTLKYFKEKWYLQEIACPYHDRQAAWTGHMDDSI